MNDLKYLKKVVTKLHAMKRKAFKKGDLIVYESLQKAITPIKKRIREIQ